MSTMMNGMVGETLVFSKVEAGKTLPPPDTSYRAVHQIRLASISHNFSCVESAATRQRCSVIVVVKADGYGHGAVESAIHLADHVGADAFAVATLEEGIALRKAFESTPPSFLPTTAANHSHNSSNATTVPGMMAASSVISNLTTSAATTAAMTMTSCNSSDSKSNASSTISPLTSQQPHNSQPPRCLRPPHIRILVLGPPVGYPRCFDDYYHHGIEVMCSGPEVARSIMEWISDETERKKTQVERAANDAKAAALFGRPAPRDSATAAAPPPPPASATTAVAMEIPAVVNTTNMNLTATINGGTNNNSAGAAKENTQQQKVYDASTGSGSMALDAVVGNATPMVPVVVEQQPPKQHYREPTLNATLGNVSGQDLAKEVRAYLMNQQAAKEQLAFAKTSVNQHTNGVSVMTVAAAGGATENMSTMAGTTAVSKGPNGVHPVIVSRHNSGVGGGNNGATGPPVGRGQVFGGIEAVAKTSRTREMAAARANGFFREDSGDDGPPSPSGAASTAMGSNTPAATAATALQINNNLLMARKRLRYHILVDSGMGRLGFKTQAVEVSDVGVRRDTVEIIQELVEMEVAGAPIEFFGMCTHMADANSTSTYTHDQINRFKGLLKRVRGAGVSIPTVSTDNSAALLTTTLTHFDAKALLSQPNADTRGFVRTGGAIYGQRPAFKQLHAVSTLLASVRHVAVLKQGESVGYDRAYIAPMSVRIATLTIGFADGYPRDLGNGVGKVAIRGHLFPVAGNVCMDMLMVELGPACDKTGPGAQVVVGDTAVLWGPLDETEGDGLVRLQDLAATLKTTQSALTCGLNKNRVLRQYV